MDPLDPQSSDVGGNPLDFRPGGYADPSEGSPVPRFNDASMTDQAKTVSRPRRRFLRGPARPLSKVALGALCDDELTLQESRSEASAVGGVRSCFAQTESWLLSCEVILGPGRSGYRQTGTPNQSLPEAECLGETVAGPGNWHFVQAFEKQLLKGVVDNPARGGES